MVRWERAFSAQRLRYGAMSLEGQGRQRVIPFAGLARQHGNLGDQLRAALDRVVATDAFILGPEVEAFEAEFADYCTTKECVGVASGTAAIALILMAAGIGQGDEVLVPGHTFIATALGVMHAGATPVFCDVDRDTGLIDPDAADAVVGARTAAVIAVHLYGQMCEMQRINAFAARHGLFVLEDAAQAHGATCDGKRAGSLGEAAAFSFYPSKNLGALGDAGAVCTGNPQLADRIRELRDLGQRVKGEHKLVGYNERLDGLQAALLRVKLPYLEPWNATRRRHAARLRENLPPDLVPLAERPGTPCVYHLFPVRHKARDELVELLRAEGIDVGVHYARAAHRHEAFGDLPPSSRPMELPQSQAWAEEELSLPLYPELTEAELDRILSACQAACARLATAL